MLDYTLRLIIFVGNCQAVIQSVCTMEIFKITDLEMFTAKIKGSFQKKMLDIFEKE